MTTPWGSQSVTWNTPQQSADADAAYLNQLDEQTRFQIAHPEQFNWSSPYDHWQREGISKGLSYGGVTNPDQPSITQTYTPEYQKLLDTNRQLTERMGLLGLGAADIAGGTLDQPLTFDQAPGAPEAYRQSLSLNRTPTPDVFDPNSVPLPGTAEQTRRAVIDAMMGRANEDYAKSTDQANSDLIAAGIRPGTKAYGDRMQMIERSRNDARQQAEIAGGNAAAQQFGLDLSRANLISGLQGQRFGQQLQSGSQDFGQQLSALQAERSGQQQTYGQQLDARRQAITEALAKRQQPINEISAFRSGSQIQPLSFPGVSPTPYSPAPIYGAAQQQYQSDLANYNASASQSGNLMSGLFSLGAAAMGAPWLGAAMGLAGAAGR